MTNIIQRERYIFIYVTGDKLLLPSLDLNQVNIEPIMPCDKKMRHTMIYNFKSSSDFKKIQDVQSQQSILGPTVQISVLSVLSFRKLEFIHSFSSKP